MKPSLILRTTSTPILLLAALYSLYILLRGHNAPGGGFIGGLIAGVGILFYAIGRGRDDALRLLRLPPIAFCAIGVSCALVSGLFGLLPGTDYLTHQWSEIDLLGFAFPLGTTLLFDLGVYLTVLGTVSTIFLNLVRR